MTHLKKDANGEPTVTPEQFQAFIEAMSRITVTWAAAHRRFISQMDKTSASLVRFIEEAEKAKAEGDE